MEEDEEEINEFDEYIQERVICDNFTTEYIIQHWNDRKERWPNLYKLAMKYMACLASSCSSERLFSDANEFYQKRRTRMLLSLVEDECILKSFFDFNGIDDLIHFESPQ